VLGLLSRSILVALLGTAAANAGANAFDVANKLPNLIYALVAGGALNAVLVPQIVRADRDGERGREFLDRLFTMTTVALLVLSIVLTLAARPLVLLYTDDWRAQDLDLAVAFALWCIPQLFFYGVYTLFGQLLNARGSFGPYTWAPVANNVVAVAGLVAFFVAFGPQPFTEARDWTPAMVALLAGSATLGVAAQAVILVVPLRRIGFRWVPRWGLRGVGFRTAGTVAAWTFAGVVVGQLVFLLVSNVSTAAKGRTEGTALAEVTASGPAWTNAFLLYMLPHSLLAVSLVTAVFTQVSGSASRGDTAAVAQQTGRIMRVLLVGVTLPAAGLALFASPIAALLFGQTGEQAAVVGDVAAALALGLPFFSVLYLVRRVFYAFEDGRTPFWITVVTSGTWAVGIVVTYLVLPVQLWVVGIALGLSAGEVAGLVAASVLLRRRVGDLGLRSWLWVLVRLALVLAVVGPLALLAGDAAGGVGSRLDGARALLAGGTVLVLGYLAGTRLLRVAETGELVTALTSRFARAGGRSSRRG
jgi:putative peptidoglycan lipid II flippase